MRAAAAVKLGKGLLVAAADSRQQLGEAFRCGRRSAHCLCAFFRGGSKLRCAGDRPDALHGGRSFHARLDGSSARGLFAPTAQARPPPTVRAISLRRRRHSGCAALVPPTAGRIIPVPKFPLTPVRPVTSAHYPNLRPRRLRAHAFVRALVRETRIAPAQLIQPLFVAEGAQKGAVASMPGIVRLDLAELVAECRALQGLGIAAVALFPVIPPALKNDQGSEALNAEGLVPRAIKAVKSACPELGVVVDIALDPYTSHGHDGVLDAAGYVDNDATVELLRKQALVLARAGADVVAPSDMMDGRVGAIRSVLERDGQKNTVILSYAAKYASAFYGPFRDAVGSAKALRGDKRTYQMDPGNTDEALREVALDLAEGADIVMVKPGLPYLDVIRRVKERFGVPVAAYQVSGEYAMLRAAIDNGWLDERKAILESLTCLRRAGADMILTYFARQAAQWLADAD
ncbi:MAG: porphobilinogen synthase [Nevskia sp.]|nr:porphobilinogen synthase [Nevskia sp.]